MLLDIKFQKENLWLQFAISLLQIVGTNRYLWFKDLIVNRRPKYTTNIKCNFELHFTLSSKSVLTQDLRIQYIYHNITYLGRSEIIDLLATHFTKL